MKVEAVPLQCEPFLNQAEVRTSFRLGYYYLIYRNKYEQVRTRTYASFSK